MFVLCYFYKIFLWSSNNGKCWERRVKNYFSELGTWHLENCNHWKSELFNYPNNINGNKNVHTGSIKVNWKLSITFLQ